MPGSPRQAGQRLAAALADEAGADQHDERSGENREIQARPIEREPVIERDESESREGASCSRHMRIGDVRIAGDDMVQVDKVALGDRKEPAPVHLGTLACSPQPAPAREPHGECRRREPEQERDKARDAHAQKSLQRRSESSIAAWMLCIDTQSPTRNRSKRPSPVVSASEGWGLAAKSVSRSVWPRLSEPPLSFQ